MTTPLLTKRSRSEGLYHQSVFLACYCVYTEPHCICSLVCTAFPVSTFSLWFTPLLNGAIVHSRSGPADLTQTHFAEMDIWVISDQELLLLQMPLPWTFLKEFLTAVCTHVCGVYTWRKEFFVGNTKLPPKWCLLKERHWDLGFVDPREPRLSFENLF